MANGPPDKFSLHVPDEDEPERSLPDRLELIDQGPRGRPAARSLGAGAYNPYESQGVNGDTARSRRPRVDLRQLSEWIKTTQKVRTLREEEVAALRTADKDKDG